MSSILEDLQRLRNRTDATDGAMNRFLNWQAGRPQDIDPGLSIPADPDAPEFDPGLGRQADPDVQDIDPGLAVPTDPDAPDIDPGLAVRAPYYKHPDEDGIKAQMPMPAQDPEEPPADMPLIQQLQQQPDSTSPFDKKPASEPESQGGYAEGYEKGEDGMLRPKAKPQQYAGPVTPDGRMPEKVENPQPADLNVTAADIQKKQDDEDTASVLAQEDGMSLSDVGLPEYSYIDETDGRDSWRNADLSPLPGEEMLHPDVRKWADTNKTAGGTGLQGLRQKYLEEVPVKSRKLIGFNQWLESEQHRVDPDEVELDENGNQKVDANGNTIGAIDDPTFDPENGLGYRGNREALNRRSPMPGLQGSRVDSHRANLRKQKVIGSYLQRYGEESVLSNPLEREEAESIYDKAYEDALANGENPVLAAGRALHSGTQALQQDKDSQLRQNVSNRTSQNHRAQRFGVPVGLVAAVDQYKNAGNDPYKQQQALLMGAMQYPQIFLPIYQSQSYASNQAAAIAGMNADGGVGGGATPPAPPVTFKEGAERPSEVDPAYATNEHVQTARLQGLKKGGATHLIPVTSRLLPEQGRQIFAQTFAPELQEAKNVVLGGQGVLPEVATAIRNYLGATPTIDDMRQVFGPMSEEDYEKLRVYFSGTSEQGWSDWAGGSYGDFIGGVSKALR